MQAVVEHDDGEGKDKGRVLATECIGMLLMVLSGEGLQNPLDFRCLKNILMKI